MTDINIDIFGIGKAARDIGATIWGGVVFVGAIALTVVVCAPSGVLDLCFGLFACLAIAVTGLVVHYKKPAEERSAFVPVFTWLSCITVLVVSMWMSCYEEIKSPVTGDTFTVYRYCDLVSNRELLDEAMDSLSFVTAEQMLKRHDEDPFVLAALGDMYLRDREDGVIPKANWNEAWSAYRAARKHSKNYFYPYYSLGFMYELDSFKHTTWTKKGLFGIKYIAREEVEWNNKCRDKAIDMFQEAIKYVPDNNWVMEINSHIQMLRRSTPPTRSYCHEKKAIGSYGRYTRTIRIKPRDLYWKTSLH
ncbi:MAG: hypothetical protein KJ749_10420 [Planctomycetes bacterium]|nr:hypothetical protein [Planctomycetota bacterium]